MIVTCPNCNKEYTIDESRIPPGGAMGRCKPCNISFKIEPPLKGDEITCSQCGFMQHGGFVCRQCGHVFDKPELEQNKGMAQPQAPPFGATASGAPQGFGPGVSGPATETQTSQPGPRSDETRFPLWGVIRYGLKIAWSNIFFFIGILLLSVLMMAMPDVIGQLLVGKSGGGAIIFRLVIAVVSIYLNGVFTMGLIRIALNFAGGGSGKLDDLFSCYSPSLVFTYFISSILYSLAVAGGMILLIIPGIIFMIQLMFYTYFIVDREAGPIEALKLSSQATKGAKLELFVLMLMLLGVNLLGALAIGIGLFLTIPASMITMAYVYKILVGEAQYSAG